MKYRIDLNKRHFTRHKGDICIIGTWLLDGEHDDPCLILIRDGEEYNEHTVPCVVPLNQGYMWSHMEGIGDPERASMTAEHFAAAMRMPDDVRVVVRIALLIEEHLVDLFSIPPYQRELGEVEAELTVTNAATGETKEVEIREDDV